MKLALPFILLLAATPPIQDGKTPKPTKISTPGTAYRRIRP